MGKRENTKNGILVGHDLWSKFSPNPWARAAASQGATFGRQDIPVQDEEMSVTTCYANPQAEEGKSGEGDWTGKTVLTKTVFVCALAGGIMYVHAFLCMSVCVL